MKKNYDFSKGKRGAVLEPEKGKTRITIRLDSDIIEWFKAKVTEQGGGNYQTMINGALRAFIEHQDPSLEKMLRRIIREEIKRAS